MNTRELAKAMGIETQTVNGRLYNHGSFYGIKPQRAPDGCLIWPSAEVVKAAVEKYHAERLAKGSLRGAVPRILGGSPRPKKKR